MKWENILAEVKDKGAVALKSVANTDRASLRAQVLHFVKRHRIATGAAAVAVLLLGGYFFIWRGSSTAEGATGPASPMPLVVAQTVKVTRLAPEISLAGTVVSLNDAQLASDVDGKVTWIADVGTIVKAGDIVARLDQSLAAMQLASDKANVAKLEAQLKYDRSQADRMQNLFRQNAIAKATSDQAASASQQDSAALTAAQAAVAKSQYNFDHSEIRAPFPGRVVSRLINPGEYATAGKAVARLVDIGSIEVSAQAPIQDAQYVHEGMTLPTLIEGRTVPATVRAVVPVGDQLSRTVEVRLSVAAGAAFVGDSAKVMVPSGTPHEALAVPRDALLLREDSTYLFKLDKKDTALRVAVETGTIAGNMVEVTGQIAPGDRVIIRGAERLETGQKVRVAGTDRVAS
jgi:RND family efflux transporter MFP subunit